MRRYLYTWGIVLLGISFSCSTDEGGDLPSADDRRASAIEDLQDDLTSPINGWKVNYRPNVGNGTYFMLLNFNDDGTVIIHSDVIDSNGEDYFEQQIQYRIDASLGLELIFETYGVFHYLFEQEQATFGAEFVFTYLEEDNNNLFFESKSDAVNKTLLELVPAQAGDIDLFSIELVENLNQFSGLTPQALGETPPIQQLVLIDKGISIFWSIDLLRRVIDVDVAGQGTTLDEIIMNNNIVTVDHQTGFSIQNEKVILDEPFTFSLNGETNTVTEVTFTNFSTETTSFCQSESQESPLYTGNISGLGSITVRKSLFNSKGLDFTPMTESPYSVNALFIFDGNGNSLLQNGSIANKFPDASGFVFNYGFASESEPTDAIGFNILDNSGQTKTYLRELTSVVREGNKLIIELADLFYYSDTPDVDDEQNLKDITNEIFEGGQVYLYDFPVDGIKVFILFNPCNQYEVLLVQ